jgi:hypothetical protein
MMHEPQRSLLRARETSVVGIRFVFFPSVLSCVQLTFPRHQLPSFGKNIHLNHSVLTMWYPIISLGLAGNFFLRLQILHS